LGPGWATASNTPFRRHKVWTLEGGISTPLIVSLPKKLAGTASANGLRHDLGHVIDILPTILDAAGYEGKTAATEFVPPPGESLFPVIAGSIDAEPKKRSPIYFSHEGSRAIRDGNYKLVSISKKRQGDDVWRLYDMAVDRSEQNDLSQQLPDKTAELQQIWQRLDDQFKRNAELP
jgi:arylsulfatase